MWIKNEQGMTKHDDIDNTNETDNSMNEDKNNKIYNINFI